MSPTGKRRHDIKAILADPAARRRLMVPLIVATQAREGIVTTVAQAEAAYDKVRAEVLAAHGRETSAFGAQGLRELRAPGTGLLNE